MSDHGTTARVPGHTLRHEGRVYDRYRGWVSDTGGSGVCSCGEKSEWLGSCNARKRWHREHKATVIAEHLNKEAAGAS